MSWENKLQEKKSVVTAKAKHRSKYNIGAFYCDKEDKQDQVLWSWVTRTAEKFGVARAAFLKAVALSEMEKQQTQTKGEGK